MPVSNKKCRTSWDALTYVVTNLPFLIMITKVVTNLLAMKSNLQTNIIKIAVAVTFPGDRLQHPTIPDQNVDEHEQERQDEQRNHRAAHIWIGKQIWENESDEVFGKTSQTKFSYCDNLQPRKLFCGDIAGWWWEPTGSGTSVWIFLRIRIWG